MSKEIHAGDAVKIKSLRYRESFSPTMSKKYLEREYLNKVFVVDTVANAKFVVIFNPRKNESLVWHIDEIEFVASHTAVERRFEIGDEVFFVKPKDNPMFNGAYEVLSYEVIGKAYSGYVGTDGQDIMLYKLAGVPGLHMGFRLNLMPSHMYRSLVSDYASMSSAVEDLESFLNRSKRMYENERMHELDAYAVDDILKRIESKIGSIRKWYQYIY